jgi:hypothetical protein
MEEYKSVADKQSNKVRKKHSFKATMFLSPSSKVQTNIYKHFFVVSLKKKCKKRNKQSTLAPGFVIWAFNNTISVAPNFPSRSNTFDDNHVWHY